MAALNNLIATTLFCEPSHVIAFQFGSQSARNHLSTGYGVPISPVASSGDSGPAHHPWTHQGPSPARTRALQTFTTFYSEKVALLVDKLKTTNDASGKPLLDSTVVLWLSELGGNSRKGDAHNTGCLSAMQYMGLADVTTVGKTDVSGPLASLVG